MTLYLTEGCGHECELSDAEIDEALDRHNELRLTEPATNMQQMVGFILTLFGIIYKLV